MKRNLKKGDKIYCIWSSFYISSSFPGVEEDNIYTFDHWTNSSSTKFLMIEEYEGFNILSEHFTDDVKVIRNKKLQKINGF